MLTKADIEKQALQEETASAINREAEILRATSVYGKINDFIDFYGILYTLRVFGQVVADKFKENEHYCNLVGTICSLYTFYSTLTLERKEEKPIA